MLVENEGEDIGVYNKMLGGEVDAAKVVKGERSLHAHEEEYSGINFRVFFYYLTLIKLKSISYLQ